MKTDRLMLAMTFMSVVLFGTTLYAQQEVNPTWYNPWPEPARVTAHSSPVAIHQSHSKNIAALPELQVAKLRAKRVASRQTQSTTADGQNVAIARTQHSDTRNASSALIIPPDPHMFHRVALRDDWDTSRDDGR